MAASDYFAKLGLEFDPFASNAMPEFFFVGGQRRFIAQRAAQIVYFSGSIVLLLGASGAGKTRMLDEIVGELRDVTDICRVDTTVLMDVTAVRLQLAACVGLSPAASASNAELILALERSRPADGDPHPILLIIDAAHLLPVEALRECATLAQSAGGRIRLLLAGEFDLATAWSQISDGGTEILQLPSLSAADTADYLHTRLQAAGSSVAMPLPRELLDLLYAQSGGNIGAIHRLAPQLFAAAEQPSNTRTMPRWSRLPLLHIAIAAGLLTVVILLLLYRGSDKPSEATTTHNMPVQNDDKTQQRIPLALPQRPLTQRTAPTIDAEPSIAARDTGATSAKPSEALPAQTPALAEKPKAVAPEPAPKPAAKPVLPAPSNPEAVPVAKSAPDNGAFSADERALLALPSQQVVLQLIGAESRATIDKFAANAGQDVKLYVYGTRLRGKPWYIAVTGPYSDRNTAAAAIAKLPEVLRKQQPWPRGVAAIQSDIKAHNGHY